MENTEKIFLKEQEMNEYRVLQDKINQVIYSMGEVAIEKQILKEKEERALNSFNRVRKEETNFLKKMERNYGSGIINPETGEFTKQD
jgi:ElaB/YqjD/DUF883 family membrane-anchored ribosome-binding protein